MPESALAQRYVCALVLAFGLRCAGLAAFGLCWALIPDTVWGLLATVALAVLGGVADAVRGRAQSSLPERARLRLRRRKWRVGVLSLLALLLTYPAAAAAAGSPWLGELGWWILVPVAGVAAAFTVDLGLAVREARAEL